MQTQEMENELQEKDNRIQELEERVKALEEGGKKKRRKKLFIFLGIIAALFLAAIVTVFVMMNNDKESPLLAEQMLQAMVNHDVNAAYDLLYPGLFDKEEFVESFNDMCYFWTSQGGKDTFTLKRTGWSMQAQGGITQYEVDFSVTSGEGTFHIHLVRTVQGERAGVTTFKIS